jgi:hypothetical protein
LDLVGSPIKTVFEADLLLRQQQKKHPCGCFEYGVGKGCKKRLQLPKNLLGITVG